MSYHSLSRAITTNPALSLVILSYHPSYNQDFSELWNHPTPSNLSFDNVIPYPVLSRQILPYHFLSLVITNLITKIFFRTLKSPHPFESFYSLLMPNPPYHSLSQDFSELYHPYQIQIMPYHLLSLAITHLITKIFQNSEITHPFEFIFDDVIPYPVLSRQILPYHFSILSYYQSYNQDFFPKITTPIWIYPLMTSFLIPCYHPKSSLITCYP